MFSSKLQKIAVCIMVASFLGAIAIAVYQLWFWFAMLLVVMLFSGAFVWLEHSIGEDRSARPKGYNNRFN